jgi:hypothetical protein
LPPPRLHLQPRKSNRPRPTLMQHPHTTTSPTPSHNHPIDAFRRSTATRPGRWLWSGRARRATTPRRTSPGRYVLYQTLVEAHHRMLRYMKHTSMCTIHEAYEYVLPSSQTTRPLLPHATTTTTPTTPNHTTHQQISVSGAQKQAGELRSFGGLTYLRVYHAGHMVRACVRVGRCVCGRPGGGIGSIRLHLSISCLVAQRPDECVRACCVYTLVHTHTCRCRTTSPPRPWPSSTASHTPAETSRATPGAHTTHTSV